MVYYLLFARNMQLTGITKAKILILFRTTDCGKVVTADGVYYIFM